MSCLLLVDGITQESVAEVCARVFCARRANGSESRAHARVVSAHHISNFSRLTIMKIGVPKEIKTNENRVALVPAGAESLVAAGHSVLMQQGAGEGSGFSDKDYTDVGANDRT